MCRCLSSARTWCKCGWAWQRRRGAAGKRSTQDTGQSARALASRGRWSVVNGRDGLASDAPARRQQERPAAADARRVRRLPLACLCVRDGAAPAMARWLVRALGCAKPRAPAPGVNQWVERTWRRRRGRGSRQRAVYHSEHGGENAVPWQARAGPGVKDVCVVCGVPLVARSPLHNRTKGKRGESVSRAGPLLACGVRVCRCDVVASSSSAACGVGWCSGRGVQAAAWLMPLLPGHVMRLWWTARARGAGQAASGYEQQQRTATKHPGSTAAAAGLCRCPAAQWRVLLPPVLGVAGIGRCGVPHAAMCPCCGLFTPLPPSACVCTPEQRMRAAVVTEACTMDSPWLQKHDGWR
jgi:hypothetical protein